MDGPRICSSSPILLTAQHVHRQGVPRCGVSENRVQWIGMVMDLCRENGNPEPESEMRMDGLVSMMYPAVAEAPPYLTQQVVLTRKQEEVIAILPEDPSATASRIGSLTGMGERTVYRMLAEVSDPGVVVNSGTGKIRRYQVYLDED